METAWLVRIASGLARQPIDSLPVLDRPYPDLAAALALAGETRRARAVLAEYDRLQTESVRRQDEEPYHLARGTIALAERNHREAIAELERVPGPLCTVCGLPELGLAFEMAGEPDSALSVYTRYLRTPSLRRMDASDGFHRARVTTRIAALRARAAAH